MKQETDPLNTIMPSKVVILLRSREMCRKQKTRSNGIRYSCNEAFHALWKLCAKMDENMIAIKNIVTPNKIVLSILTVLPLKYKLMSIMPHINGAKIRTTLNFNSALIIIIDWKPSLRVPLSCSIKKSGGIETSRPVNTNITKFILWERYWKECAFLFHFFFFKLVPRIYFFWIKGRENSTQTDC